MIDVVKRAKAEAKAIDPDDEVVRATRDSIVRRLDLRSPTGALRQLVFDHAATSGRRATTPGIRPLLSAVRPSNQDVEGATEVWRFFRD